MRGVRLETCVNKAHVIGGNILLSISMPRPAHRHDRISLRLSPQSKRTLERAAAYLDKTLTDFGVDVALDKAETVVREHEVITLTMEEWEHFRDLKLKGRADSRCPPKKQWSGSEGRRPPC